MTILNNNYKNPITNKPFSILETTENFVLAMDTDADPLNLKDNPSYYIIHLQTQKVDFVTNSIITAMSTLPMAEEMYQVLLNKAVKVEEHLH